MLHKWSTATKQNALKKKKIWREKNNQQMYYITRMKFNVFYYILMLSW